MMQRRHLEDAFAGEFERGDLRHHRQRFGEKQPVDNRREEFILGQNRDGTECATEGASAPTSPMKISAG